jgi:hypothetical protein
MRVEHAVALIVAGEAESVQRVFRLGSHLGSTVSHAASILVDEAVARSAGLTPLGGDLAMRALAEGGCLGVAGLAER